MRDEERFRYDQALAYSLLFKAMAMDANLSHLQQHVLAAEKLASERKTLLSAVMFALVNVPGPIDFEPAEMAMLLKLRDDDVFNQVLNFDRIHNSILPVWELYGRRREAMSSHTEQSEFDSKDGKTEFVYRRGGPADRNLFETEQIAVQLAERAKKDAAEASEIVSELAQLLNDRLKIGVSLQKKAQPTPKRNS